jgi:hypothetical protein
MDPDAWRILELQAGAPPILLLLALAVPSVPYAAKTGLHWEETAPIMPIIGLTHWLGLTLAPYIEDPFAKVRCECVSAPDEQNSPLVIETHLETAWQWLPTKLTCQFERLRGPVRLEANFRSGTLIYNQMSFEPGLPFNVDIT